MNTQESPARMLLSSAGPTTEAIQEQLLGMVRTGGTLKGQTVLRVADGWTPFSNADGLPRGERLRHSAESAAARLWSGCYAGHILSGATIITAELGTVSPEVAKTLLQKTDMLLVPGGNTYQTLRGLAPHRAEIAERVQSGEMAYMGESAGSILAGITTAPASLEPADARPHVANMNHGLGLLPADVVVHAAVEKRRAFAVAGSVGRIANRVFGSMMTDQARITSFVAERGKQGTHVVALHDLSALAVFGSMTGII